MIKHIAIFASGNGSNFQHIAEYFSGRADIEISALYCNKADAYAVLRAATLGIPVVVFGREQFYNTSEIPDDLHTRQIDWIVLAGFMWLVPQNILRSFRNRVVNIHPALLPKHGGRGMYGMRVHEAVIEAGDSESGITIHIVNEHYDEGQIVFRATCPVIKGDTAENIAQKIHQLEYKYYPRVIEELLQKNNPGC
jgi:phosphoribosylglycinamide formyltransferase 1